MKLLGHVVDSFNHIWNWRWARQKRRHLLRWAQGRSVSSRSLRSGTPHLLFLCEEFFHPDLRGYGGFGKTVKNITDHLNRCGRELKGAVAIPQAVPMIQRPERRAYHGVPVALRPYENPLTDTCLNRYADLLADLQPFALLAIDWYPSYEVPVHALPDTPLIIWIHDPRDRYEWEKIAAVPDELRFRRAKSTVELLALAHEKEQSIKRILALQRRITRKIVFATTARSLIPRAERTYGIGPLQAHWLPNPVEIPAIAAPEQTGQPSLLYLGRLDAVKRPWIAFELARRHPDIDFLIAGQAHNAELIDPWLARYRGLPNLRLLGHVDGEEKDRLLRTCWALLNTSAHEAEPVSFLEAFSYGKCVVACHDPDGAVSNFGYYTGEVRGEGLDESSLHLFDTQIELLLRDENARLTKGLRARDEMVQHHSFESFKRHLETILRSEGIESHT